MDQQRESKATLPIPVALREEFYLAMWELAIYGYFYSSKPSGGQAFLDRFGTGSLMARRHGLTILWLTAVAGRFNELASMRLTDVDGCNVKVYRSKGGKPHSLAVDQELIHCTKAWHARVGQQVLQKNSPREQARLEAMHRSALLLPSVNGGQMNINVFNRDVAGPLGALFGCKLSSHCFRSTACQLAARLVKENPSLDSHFVKSIMGHSSIQTTEIYLRKQESEQLPLPLSNFQ